MKRLWLMGFIIMQSMLFSTASSADNLRSLNVGECVVISTSSAKYIKELCYSGFTGFNVVVSIKEQTIIRSNQRGAGMVFAFSTPYYLKYNNESMQFQSTIITYIKDKNKIVVKY